MSQEPGRHEITKKTVVYRLPGTEKMSIRRDIPYRTTEAGPLTMEIYEPVASPGGGRRPAVVFVIAGSDEGARKILGCRFQEMESYIAWGRLVAASGLVGITYACREPEADLHALLQHLRENGAALGVDEGRIGIWACSGNGPLALSVLMHETGMHLGCAALCYAYTLDLDGSTGVQDAMRTYRFANPTTGKSVRDLPREKPLFVARAGQDQTPGLNEALDRFVAHALVRNLPITVVNHASGPHAFDLLHDSDASREVIRQILAFLRFHLKA